MDCTVHGVARRRTRLSLYHCTSLSLSCFGIPLAQCWDSMKSKRSVASCVGVFLKDSLKALLPSNLGQRLELPPGIYGAGLASARMAAAPAGDPARTLESQSRTWAQRGQVLQLWRRWECEVLVNPSLRPCPDSKLLSVYPNAPKSRGLTKDVPICWWV